MKLAILGAGRIGSTFALHLARAGHDVTVVARGLRLEELTRAGAIVDVSGPSAPVSVASSLDAAVAFDAVLVTVLAHQLDDTLPALAVSHANVVIFLLNTFTPLDRLREAVAPKPAVFGFPVFVAELEAGRLRCQVDRPGQGVTIDDAGWAETFRCAKLPTRLETDMASWRRSHAAGMAPLMAAARLTKGSRGLTWQEAARHAVALGQGLAVVRALGHRVIPAVVALIGALPTSARAALFWSLSRTPVVRSLGTRGADEARALIEAIVTAAPRGTPTDALEAIKP